MSPCPEAASTAHAESGARTSPETALKTPPETLSVTLRYFAAAVDAAGRPEERLDLPVGTTLSGLREQLAGRDLEMARVVPICSFLVNSVSTPADSLTPLTDGDAVDVLPPFAGG